MENRDLEINESNFIAENTSNKDENIPMKRKEGISYWAAFMNFFRTLLGPGCLALPVAVKNAGWLASFILIPILGFFNAYCMVMLVNAAQYLSRKKGQGPLELGEVAVDACSNSFPFMKKYGNAFRHVVNACVIGLQMGITSVYYVFVSVHSKEIIEQYTDIRLSDTVYMLTLFVPFVLINCLRTLRIIAFLSGLGNILMFISLVGIFQFLIRQPHLSFSNLPSINTFNGILTASGSIIYAYEGLAVVLPIENKIKKPHQMLGFFGVISTGISNVTIFYILCGILGYITYGNDVKGSISLNLPNDPLYSVLKGLLIVVVFLGFVLQQYVVIELTFPKSIFGFYLYDRGHYSTQFGRHNSPRGDRLCNAHCSSLSSDYRHSYFPAKVVEKI